MLLPILKIVARGELLYCDSKNYLHRIFYYPYNKKHVKNYSCCQLSIVYRIKFLCISYTFEDWERLNNAAMNMNEYFEIQATIIKDRLIYT